jgi:asparagine synthase (glutamine-hydrolysing)
MSGGIDSAAVVAIMRQLSGKRVKTFTVGFDGRFAQDERSAARRSAELLGVEHHEIAISAKDCLETLGAVAWHLDEPIATPSAVPMFFLSRLAASHVKVVLTGQGADEPWAGYRRYRSEKIGRWYRRLPAAWRRGVMSPLLQHVPRAEATQRFADAFDFVDAAQRFARLYAVFTPATKRALYRDDFPEGITDGTDALRYWQEEVAHLEPLAQQLYVETRLSLPDNLLLYGDKMTMAFSLEARVPLLDAQLMEFTENLPVDWRLKRWSGHKYLYRKAIRRWLPDEILNRPKIGFKTPMDQWLRGLLAGDLAERIGAPDSACGRYFDLSYIDTMIREHASGRNDHARPLFSLLMFEAWHRQFLGAA